VLANIVEAGLVFLLEGIGHQRHVFARIFRAGAPPMIQVAAIEQSGEPAWRFVFRGQLDRRLTAKQG